MISFQLSLRILSMKTTSPARLSQPLYTLSRQKISSCPGWISRRQNGPGVEQANLRIDAYGRTRRYSGPNVGIIVGASLARYFPVYGWKILTLLLVGGSSTIYWLLYRAVGLSKEEEEKLKSFVISKDKKIVALGLNQRIDSHDVTEVAELHMHRLLKLFLNLASQSRDGLVITKESWERAHSSLPAEERAIADLLFHGGDLDNNPSLSFAEFAKLAVLKSAAEQGDADSQVELLFELIDADGRGSITFDQCARFIATCMRAGKLSNRDHGPHAAANLTARLFATGGAGDNHPVTRDEFHRAIGPALYRDVWRPSAARAVPGPGPDFSAILAEYRALRSRRTPLLRAPPFPNAVLHPSAAAHPLYGTAHPPAVPRIAQPPSGEC